jgi:hypothetical protein
LQKLVHKQEHRIFFKNCHLMDFDLVYNIFLAISQPIAVK